MHRSNSMSTLPSLCREEANERMKCLNRSMHEDIDHNLTYSYSSSEDSLNESFSINFTPKKPRSAQASQVRALYATPSKVRQEASTSGSGNRKVPVSPPYLGGATSTPAKPILDRGAYLQKMHEDMDKVDKKLELVVKIEQNKQEITKLDEEDEEMDFSESLDLDISEEAADGVDKLKKMEDMMKDLNQQSEEIHKMFR